MMSAVVEDTQKPAIEIRRVSVDQTGDWLTKGWQDFRDNMGVSLTWGIGFVVASWIVTAGLLQAGMGSLILPLVGGFMLVAPLSAVGLYEVAKSHERGEKATLATTFRFGDNIGQIGAMGVVLAITYLAWTEVAFILFAVFFNESPPALGHFVEDVVFAKQGPVFLFVGSIVGAIFAALVFSVSAVSIPLLKDRRVDLFTAMISSVRVVLANRRAMFGWATAIGLVTLCGIATFFVGLAIALPVLAYATWHAYRDLVVPEA